MRTIHHLGILFLFGITLLQPCIADIQFDDIPNPLVAGQRNVFHYQGGDDTKPATILLLEGEGAQPRYILTVTTNALGGSYAWDPFTYLENGDHYWLDISQEGSGETRVGCRLVGGNPSSTSSSSAKTAGSQHTTSTHSTSPIPTAKRPNLRQPTSHGLSTSVAAGIGVGAAVLIIALVAILIFVCYRLRKLRAEKRSPPVISKPSYYGSSVQLVDNPMERTLRSMYEKDSQTSLREFGTNANRYEIGGKARSMRYELGS